MITRFTGWMRTKLAWNQSCTAFATVGGIKFKVMGIKNPSLSAWNWTLHVKSRFAPLPVDPRSRRRVAAPPGFTPYRVSTPGPRGPRETQVYPESADRGDFSGYDSLPFCSCSVTGSGRRDCLPVWFGTT